jgi:hypothetical protein
MSSLSGSKSKRSSSRMSSFSNTGINLPPGDTIEGCNALLNSASNEIVILQGMVRYLLNLRDDVKEVPKKWEKVEKVVKGMGFNYKTMDIRGSNLYMLAPDTITHPVSKRWADALKEVRKSKKKSL